MSREITFNAESVNTRADFLRRELTVTVTADPAEILAQLTPQEITSSMWDVLLDEIGEQAALEYFAMKRGKTA